MINSDISCVKETKEVTYYGTNSGYIKVKVDSGLISSISETSDKRLILTSSNGSIKILDNSLKVLDTLEDHKGMVWKAIEIGGKIYSVGGDNTLKIWEKVNGKYNVEKTINIQNPKDIKQINDKEVIVNTIDNSPIFINLQSLEQKKLENKVDFKSLDDSFFFVDNKIVIVGTNSLKLLNPENKQIIFNLDNKESKIYKTTCNQNFLYTIQYNNSNNELEEMVVFKVQNNQIIKITGNDFKKSLYDLLEFGTKNKDLNELKKEIIQYENSNQFTLLNPNNYNLITTEEDFKFFSLNINPNVKHSYELLYKATADGQAASTFHTKCDGKGETVTVVKILNGSKCGGFTPISWQKTGCWQKDPSLRSFVFNLDNKRRFNLRQNYNYALDFHDNKLSCFGGYTLQLTDNNLSNKNGICNACDYEIESPNDLIGINETSFQAVDIEVFLVRTS